MTLTPSSSTSFLATEVMVGTSLLPSSMMISSGRPSTPPAALISLTASLEPLAAGLSIEA